jgi:hypothetical protein
MSDVAAGVAKARKGVRLTSELGFFQFFSHGRAIQVFGPLLRNLDKNIGRDIVALQRAFGRCSVSSSEAAFRLAEDAAGRLRTQAAKLRPAEQQVVLVEIDRQMQTLQNKRNGFGKLFAEDVEEAARKKAAATAVARATSALEKTKDADKLIAHLGDVIAAHRFAEDAVAEIWSAFLRYGGMQSPGVRKAAEYVAGRPQKIKALIESGALSEELWGHVRRVVGFMGEDYGLLNPVWLNRSDELMKAAEGAAKQLNDLLPAAKAGGYEVRYLTQLDHTIRINGREGPDAIIAIFHPERKEFYFFATIQVKTANTSEGLVQVVDGLFRSAGKTGDSGKLVPFVEFVLDGEPLAFPLSRNPAVTESFHVINAAGSMIPPEDVDLIRRIGMQVTELKFDMSVDQFVHMALDFMEAAARAF